MFPKRKKLLQSFISIFIYNQSNKYFNIWSYTANLSYLFNEKKTCLFSHKLKLGQGHFSSVFCGIDKEHKKEVAIKVSRYPDKINDYQPESNILLKFVGKDFYPQVYCYDDELFKDYLEITLMGPTLYDYYKFYDDCFDRKTILNIFDNLINKIRYLSKNKIIHHDIKTDNIVLGIFENNQFKDSKELYFIDYGCSYFMGEEFNIREDIDRFWNCGKPNYMSLNTHLNKKPGTIDDIESLIYTLFKLSKISLPWENTEISNLYRNKAILEMKQHFNFEKICGVEYEFLSKAIVYLKKIK